MHGSAHKSRRCTTCGVHWPADQKQYERCPECDGPLWDSTADAIPDVEAWSRKTHAEFERWLDQHDRRGTVEALERIPVKDRAA